MTFEQLSQWLIARVAAKAELALDQIDVDAPFASFGLESLDAVELSGDLSELLGQDLDPALLYSFPSIGEVAQHLADRAPGSGASSDRYASIPSSAVAIVGYSCRVPGATSPAAFWDLLLQGRDAIMEVPSDRWDVNALYDPDPSAPGKMSTRWGGFLDDVDGFDHMFFGIPPAEARAMDPQQRIILELAWEALADANLAPSALAGSKTGVFLGASHNDFEALHLRNTEGVTGYSGIGNALSVLANRLSYKLNAKGPSLVVDTACSSSLVAVHLALQSLRRGESEVALAGGVNLILAPEASIVFSKAGMMAPDGRCKTFDASANGYVRSEGGGIVVLKPLAKAIADGDPIHAVIRGSAVNQDGRTNGLSAPNPNAQEDVLRAAYRDAGVAPDEVAYVEAHGTGTNLGDPIEATALGRIVGRGGRGAPCWVGAVKSNLGHLEAAAGVIGLIKTALVVEHGKVPPNLHVRAINPKIDLAALGLDVPTVATVIPLSSLAGVSAFGFGGTNCHIVLEGYDQALPPAAKHRADLICLSAATADALDSLQDRWAKLDPDGMVIAHAAAAANQGRDHERFRRAFVATHAGELVGRLSKARARAEAVPRTAPRVAFAFAGQGAQYAEMGRDLAHRFEVFAASLRRSDEVAAEFLSLSLLDEIMRPAGESRLGETAIAQPAIAAIQIAMVDLWGSLGLAADAVIGHSVGEIAAAYCAGVLDRPAAIQLACVRGALMDRNPGVGAMLAVQLDADQVARRIGAEFPGVDVAAVNAPSNVVCSGLRSEVLQLSAQLVRDGIGAQLLPVDYAFHSRLMAEAAESLPDLLSWLRPSAPRLPIFSTVTGAELGDAPMDAGYWASNLRDAVLFGPAAEQMAAGGFETVVEIGPDRVLGPYLRRIGEGGSFRVIDGPSRRMPTEVAFLEAVGRAFEIGLRVRPDRLSSGSARSLRIPGPAWARTTDLKTARLRAVAARPDRQASAIHPLLDSEIPTPERSPLRMWVGRVDLERASWLRNHKVAGVVVLPAAAVIDLMRTIAETVLGAEATLADLTINRPLRPPANGSIEILVSAQRTKGGADIGLLARTASGQDWVSTAQVRAELSPSDAPTSAVSEARSALTRCLEQLPAALFYQLLGRVGLEYGPHFRKVSEVWRADGEALATLGASSLPGGFAAAPDVLDGALQALSAAFRGFADEEAPWVPMSVNRIDLRGVPARAHVKLASVDEHRGTATADILLLDAEARYAGALNGVRVQRLARPTRPSVSDSSDPHHHYDEIWEACPPTHPGATVGRWLVVGHGDETDTALADRLAAVGQDVIRIVAGEGFRQVDPRTFVLDPMNRNAVRDMTRRLLGTSAAPVDGIVCTWSICEGAPTTESSVAAAMLSATLGLARDIAFGATRRVPRLWLATRGAQLASAKQLAIDPTQAAVWGAGFALAFELPDLKCSRLDLDPDNVDGNFAADALADFLLSDPGGDQFAMRDATFYRRRLVETPRPISPVVGLEAEGAYLITGGFGALGLATARGLADHGARVLLLIGRNPPGPDASGALQVLRKQGVVAHEILADVADEAALREALEPVLSEGFRVRGIIHAAGVVDDGPVSEIDAAQIEQVARPKGLGARVLHDLSVDWPLDFFVLFSSASASLGSIGQGAYMAANAVLRAFANYRALQGRPALCIEWGPWADGGMATSALEAGRGRSVAGIRMIDPQEGVETLLRLIGGATRQAIVLPYDLRDLVHIYPAATGLHLFERLYDGKLEQLRSAGTAQGGVQRPDLDQPYVEPRTELEAIIVGIWQRSLGIDGIGVHDGFFELGGDSVYASQILSQINRTFGVELNAEAAFENLTVEHLAVLTERTLVASVEALSEEETELALAEDT